MAASLNGNTPNLVGSNSSSNGLSAALVAELSALVFVKLVKMVLSEGDARSGIRAGTSEQLLADDALETWAMELDEEARLREVPENGAMTGVSTAGISGAGAGSSRSMADMTDDEMVAQALAGKGNSAAGGGGGGVESGSSESGSSSAVAAQEAAVSGAQAVDEDGEVWAAESDDDDVVYEGADPAAVAKAFKDLDAPPAALPHGMVSAYGSSSSSYGSSSSSYGSGNGITKLAWARSDPLAVAASLRKRRAYVLKSFSSSMLLALPPKTWAKLEVAQDILVIIRALRKQRSHDGQTTGSVAAAAAREAGTAEGTDIPAGVQAASNAEEEAWVRYACALRDFLICRPLPASQTDTVLAVVLELFDDNDDNEGSAPNESHAATKLAAAASRMALGGSSSRSEEDTGLGPGPSMALLLCHSLATSLNSHRLNSFAPSGGGSGSSSSGGATPQHTELSALADSLRRGLCARLPLLTQGLDAATEVLVAAFAAPAVNRASKETTTEVAAAATIPTTGFSSPGMPSPESELSGSAAVALEQARVLLGCAAFGSGVALATSNGAAGSRNSNTSSNSNSSGGGGGSGRALTACPFGAPAPAALLLSSGCLRAVLKLLATLSAAPPSSSSTTTTSSASEATTPPLMPPPQVLEVARLARALLACWCAQGQSTLVDFVVRSPSTPKALSALHLSTAYTTATPVAASEPGAVLLAMVLSMGISSTSAGATSPLPGGATGFAASVHGLARDAATALLPLSMQEGSSISSSGCSTSVRDENDLGGVVSLVASLGALGPRVVVQVRAWAKKPAGSWVIPWLKALQAQLLEAPKKKKTTAATGACEAGPITPIADTSPSLLEAAEATPSPPSALAPSEEALVSREATADGDDNAEMEAAAPELAGEARGATRAAAARRAEAIRVLKQLLAVEAGGNKTD